MEAVVTAIPDRHGLAWWLTPQELIAALARSGFIEVNHVGEVRLIVKDD